MSKTGRTSDARGSALWALLRAISAREGETASRLLAASPSLARQAVEVGASCQASTTYFFEEIAHYVYAGDTALHIAAAAYERQIAQRLIAQGAQPAARNRRGAQPLHYAADGNPGSKTWNPPAQEATIKYLIEAGADPNSADKSGVAPLHRAVRTRCAAAVRALLAGGAEPLLKNKSGSTPLHLAVQTTGRGGSGSSQCQEQQRQIILLLLQHGARATDADASGKTVAQSAVSPWLQEVLEKGTR
jgi:ankyrin repeat protein